MEHWFRVVFSLVLRVSSVNWEEHYTGSQNLGFNFNFCDLWEISLNLSLCLKRKKYHKDLYQKICFFERERENGFCPEPWFNGSANIFKYLLCVRNYPWMLHHKENPVSSLRPLLLFLAPILAFLLYNWCFIFSPFLLFSSSSKEEFEPKHECGPYQANTCGLTRWEISGMEDKDWSLSGERVHAYVTMDRSTYLRKWGLQREGVIFTTVTLIKSAQ